MKIVENELIVNFDVDDTLALWSEPLVNVVGKVTIEFAGKTVYLTPHQYHIDLMKMYKERGYHVTVWSANGWRHASRVVEALKIEKYVDVVQSKPLKWVDDSTDAAGVLGTRVFCPDITKQTHIFVPAGFEYFGEKGLLEPVGIVTKATTILPVETSSTDDYYKTKSGAF